jgi:hypothetical protein
MVEEKGAFGTEYAESEWGESRADKESSRGNLSSLKIQAGETVQVRFLGKRKETLIHWNTHPDKKMLVCLRQDDPKAKCPICEFVESTGLAEGKASWRCYINVLDRRDGTVKQWDFAPQTKQQLHSIIANRGDISKDNPLSQFEIRITRKGVGLETKYEFKIANSPTALKPEDAQIVEEGVQDLDVVYKPLDEATLQQLFSEGTPVAQPQKSVSPVGARPTPTKAAIKAPVKTVTEALSRQAPSAGVAPVADEDTLF